MNLIRTTTVLFRNKISWKEIPFFRGCIIRLSGDAPLFHNHDGDGFHYSYPLVQYKRIEGCAALFGINQGVEAVEDVLGKENHFPCRLGNRNVELELASIRSEKMSVSRGSGGYTYKISHWLPLNVGNYREYLSADGLSARVTMLENILVGNILSFAKGVGIFFDFPVVCRILELAPPCLSLYKDVELMDFSVEFRCNVSLPEYIGLGKLASVNNGILTRIK